MVNCRTTVIVIVVMAGAVWAAVRPAANQPAARTGLVCSSGAESAEDGITCLTE